MTENSVGLRKALAHENPLQIAGTINAYSALLAKVSGFNAIYLSGAGVANASYGLPDIGIISPKEVLEEVYRLTDVCELPLLVDIDAGGGNAFNISRTIKAMAKAGAAGVHLEDQTQMKRCGHRPNKALVSTEEMCDRLKAALDGRQDAHFVLMARTDALAIEGLEKSILRIQEYVKTGADMIFFEGAATIAEYQAVVKACHVPVLANMTEFGLTPLFTRDELQEAGVQLILYPLSAFRAMCAAAFRTYQTIKEAGTQKSLVPTMQTREELYETLNYYQYERKLDEIFAKGKKK